MKYMNEEEKRREKESRIKGDYGWNGNELIDGIKFDGLKKAREEKRKVFKKLQADRLALVASLAGRYTLASVVSLSPLYLYKRDKNYLVRPIDRAIALAYDYAAHYHVTAGRAYLAIMGALKRVRLDAKRTVGIMQALDIVEDRQQARIAANYIDTAMADMNRIINGMHEKDTGRIATRQRNSAISVWTIGDEIAYKESRSNPEERAIAEGTARETVADFWASLTPTIRHRLAMTIRLIRKLQVEGDTIRVGEYMKDATLTRFFNRLQHITFYCRAIGRETNLTCLTHSDFFMLLIKHVEIAGTKEPKYIDPRPMTRVKIAHGFKDTGKLIETQKPAKRRLLAIVH